LAVSFGGHSLLAADRQQHLALSSGPLRRFLRFGRRRGFGVVTEALAQRSHQVDDVVPGRGFAWR